MEQLDFFIATVPLAIKAPAKKRSGTAVGTATLQTPVPKGLTIAEQLNRGLKITFPKDANAIRVTIGGKTTVILKADVDTLKGAGFATAVEFGIVKNDSKGHPVRKDFKVLAAAAVNNSNSFDGTLVLSLQ